MPCSFNSNASFNLTRPENRGFPKFVESEYHVILFMLALAILLHNSVVLHLYRKRPSLRTTTNLLLASTACADLLTGALLIPFLVCSAVLRGRSPTLNPLYFTSTVVSDLVTMAIVLNMSLVTIERYTALCHPYFYQGFITKSVIWKAIGSVWTVSGLMAIVQVVWSYPVITGKSEDISEIYKNYSIATVTLIYFLPTAIIIYCQVHMFLVVKRFATADSLQGLHTGSVARPKVKAMLVFLAMFLNVFLCWSPLMTVRLLMDISPHVTPSRAVLESLLALRCLSSLFNPGLCVWCKTDFKEAFSIVFCSVIRRNRRLRNDHHFCDNESHMMRERAF